MAVCVVLEKLMLDGSVLENLGFAKSEQTRTAINPPKMPPNRFGTLDDINPKPIAKRSLESILANHIKNPGKLRDSLLVRGSVRYSWEGLGCVNLATPLNPSKLTYNEPERGLAMIGP